MSTNTAGGGTRARSEVETGMILMSATMLLVPALDAMAKLLTATLSPGQIALGRFGFQTACLLPMVLLAGHGLRSLQPAIHAARGALIATAIVLLFWSLKYLPVANAIAIFFVEPLILTLISAAFLREAIGARRLVAVCAGLAGALVVIRPNWQAFGWHAVLPLGTALCFAVYLALTRYSAKDERSLTMQLWAGMFATLVLALAVLGGNAGGIGVLGLSWPSTGAWLLLVVLGALSAFGHVMLVIAFRMAPAAILAPFQYLEIIGATALGFLLFGDFPDAMTWLGTAIIVGAGLYVFFHERQVARAGAEMVN